MFDTTDKAIEFIDSVTTDAGVNLAMCTAYNAETGTYVATLHEAGARDPHVQVTNAPSLQAALTRLAAELYRQIAEG